MTKEEIVDGLELYTVGRPLKSQVSITVQELQNFIDAIKALKQEPCEDVVEREKIKLLAEELRHVREGIKDKQVLIGYNMAIAICNKYLVVKNV